MRMKLIDQLRAKPLHHRKRIAIGSSAAFTLVLALFWVTSFSYLNTTTPDSPEIARRNNVTSPFKIFKKGAANIYSAFSGASVDFSTDNVVEYNATPTLEYIPE